MLTSDRPIKDCAKCYHLEALGKQSKRLRENSMWRELPAVASRISEAERGDGHVDSSPFYLDLRLGNVCNLKCRMCNAANSTQWQSELAKHKDEWKRSFSYSSQDTKILNWYESDPFISDIREILPHTKHLYVTGGEPTIIPELTSLLNYAIEIGASKNIVLRFNTNVTRLKEQWLNLLPHFKRVVATLSIDAFAEQNDWIRNPSKWSEIKENVRRYCSLKGNVRLRFGTTVSVYNALYLDRLIDWRKQISAEYGRPITHGFILLTYPEFQSATLLPPHLKDEVKQRISRYLDELPELRALIRLMDGPASDDPDLKKQLKTHTEMIDRWRREDYVSVFPELDFIREIDLDELTETSEDRSYAAAL